MSLVESESRSPTKPAMTLTVTPKVAEAIRMMVEDATPWNEAANTVGLTARAMRKALEKPHVLSELRRRKQVFKECVSAKSLSRLDKIADNAGNAMAQLGAIKAIEQLNDEQRAASAGPRSPGFVIVVNTGSVAAPAAKTVIDCTVNDGRQSVSKRTFDEQTLMHRDNTERE